jgi:hypothetical protein
MTKGKCPDAQIDIAGWCAFGYQQLSAIASPRPYNSGFFT